MYKSGYQGEDSMRNFAERMMKDEVKGSRKGPVPRSMSAPEATKMRPFAEGGFGDLMKGVRNLGKPTSQRYRTVSDVLKEDRFSPRNNSEGPTGYSGVRNPGPFKKGGKAEHKAFGGMFGDNFAKYAGVLNKEAFRNNRVGPPPFATPIEPYYRKKGGRIHKKAQGGKFDDGGLAAARAEYTRNNPSQMDQFMTRYRQKTGNSRMQQGDIHTKYKKGGKAQHKAFGGPLQEGPVANNWLKGLKPVNTPARQFQRSPLLNERTPQEAMRQLGFARGGNVDQDEHEGSYHSRSPRHRMEDTQSNMRIPNKTRNAVTSRDVSNEDAHYAEGGSLVSPGNPYHPLYNPYRQLPFKKGGKVHHKLWGGFLSKSLFGDPVYARGGKADNMRLNIESKHELENFGKKRGGSAHRHHHKHHGEHDMRRMHREEHEFAKKHGKHHKGIGGLLGGLAGTYFGGPLGGIAGNALGGLLPFAEGGAAKKRGGHATRKASGGTIYEKQMNGSRPSKTAHHYNYESEMRGERAVHKSSSKRQSKKGNHDMEHGQMFAMGGPGKIHKGQMTEGGMPIPRRRVITNNLF